MLREKIVVCPLTNAEDMELCRILTEINVSGYTIVSKRTSVRLFVTIHRGPLQVVEHQEKKNLVGLSDSKSYSWFINHMVLPQFFGYNQRKDHRILDHQNNLIYDALRSPWIRSKYELLDLATARIRNQTVKINQEILPRMMDGRTDSYRATIKRDILSACRLIKKNPIEFIQSILDEFVVESIIKS